MVATIDAGARRMTSLFAYVMAEGGEERICIVRGPDGSELPMVGSDERHRLLLDSYARRLAAREGRTVRLVRFGACEQIETFEPEGGPR